MHWNDYKSRESRGIVAVKISYIAIALLILITLGLGFMLVLAQGENSRMQSELNETTLLLQDTRGELNDTKSDLAEKMRIIEIQNENNTMLAADLQDRNNEIAELGGQLNETEAELEEARGTLEGAEEEIAEIREETLAMAENINQSIQWFRDNSELPSTLKVDRFVSKTKKGCIENDVMNLACVSHLMEQELGMSYKSDPGDRLYSIDEIIGRKGGDCEDYSLFFKAFLNRFRGQGLGLEAWESGIGKYDVYFDEEEGIQWYYDNAQGREVGNLEDGKPYVACYWTSISPEILEGHCIIMLTERNITSPADISDGNLADAVFIEPQDGKYMGRMGGEFSACVEGDEACGNKTHRIVFVITDSDLFQFSEGRWDYYGGYGERTEQIFQKLDAIQTS